MNLSVEAFDRICRACLTESKDLKSLFTKLEGGQALLDLLIFTASIDANSSDKLPKQVCGDCEDFIRKASEFKRRCIESERILRDLCSNSSYNQNTLKNNVTAIQNDFSSEKPSFCQEQDLLKPELMCTYSTPDINNKNVDIQHENAQIKKEYEIEFEHDESSNGFDERDELVVIPIEVKQEDLHEPVKPLICICREEFDSSEKLKHHLKVQKCVKHRKCIRGQGLSKTYIQIRNELACPHCDLKFDSLTLWNKHKITHVDLEITEEPSQFQCSLCLRHFKTKKTLAKHLKRHETTDNIRHTCSHCKREFKYKAFLDSHMVTVHTKITDSYVCEICTAKCPTKKSLEDHLDSHKSKKNICPFCDKSFVMLCTLKDHLRIHTGEKPFLCSVCGKGFSQKTNLGQHMRRHMGIKPFNCSICNKGFVTKGEIEAHNRKHSGIHPFVCDDCGSAFTTSSALVKHRRTHTGERPYACDLCPMRFAATGTLKNHRRTHTGERPYQCSHCEKSFVQRSDLVSHIRCHTGERPFVCPQCGQAFRKAAAMKAHVKMHQRENDSILGLSGGLNGLGMHCDNQMNAV